MASTSLAGQNPGDLVQTPWLDLGCMAAEGVGMWEPQRVSVFTSVSKFLQLHQQRPSLLSSPTQSEKI